jgi:hypothetical protein
MVPRNNAHQLRQDLIPVLEFFNNPRTGSFAADVAILFGKLGSFAKSFGDTSFMNTYYKLSFAYYDKDGNGTIDREEFKLIMDDLNKLSNTVTHKSADELFKEVDINGDGVISFSEFVKMMETNEEIIKNRKKRVWRNSQEMTATIEENSSDFLNSLESVLEFIGVEKSENIISDLNSITSFVHGKSPKVLAEEIKNRMLDSLIEFYFGDENSVDVSKFALIAIDFADVTGIEYISGFVEECCQRVTQFGTEFSKEQTKKVILETYSQ